jgi:hypothetical protein
MRQRAQAAGNLQSTSQEAVSYNQGNIVLAPVNQQMIYVPTYNPWTVFGQPISPYPGFSLLGSLSSFFGSSPVRFGLGIAMTAFTHMSWGWLGWGLSWLAHSVLFQESNYYSQSTTVADWGFPNGGPRAFSQQGWMTTQANSYNRMPGGYGRSGGGYNTTQGFVRTPYGYPYGGNRLAEGYSRGYQTPGVGYARPSQEAYNRVQPTSNRPQYGRSSYGSSFYGSPVQAYHAPTASIQRGYSGQRSSTAFMGRGVAQPSGKSSHPGGGFHLFGGGHAPKGFGGGKSFSGHSGGGGHSGGKHHFL